MSYSVPKGTEAVIQYGFNDGPDGAITIGQESIPAPDGQGAIVYRIAGSDLPSKGDGNKAIPIRVYLMPRIHGEKWSPLGTDETIVPPAWSSRPVTLALTGIPFDEAIRQIAKRSELEIRLRDPEHHAATIPITVAFAGLPLKDAIDVLKLLGGARARLLDAEVTGYELSLTGASHPALASDEKLPIDSNVVSFRQARWQGDRLAVELDYQLKDAAGASLAFGFNRPGGPGFIMFDTKSSLPAKRFSGTYLLDTSTLDLSSHDFENSCSVMALLRSAHQDILATAQIAIMSKSMSQMIRLDLPDVSLAEALPLLGKACGRKIILNDPQHRAADMRLTMKADGKALIDVMTTIERLTGTIIYESNDCLFVSVPTKM